ncbi:MAG: hypothetical protein I4O51_07665 [Flavobacterium micromati]|nr:hypothetical protein [Flavobacterium micromati]
MIAKKKTDIFENAITLLLFSVVFFEIIATMMSFEVVQFAFRPSVIVLILYLYWRTSTARNILFFVPFVFLLVTSVCILFKDQYIVMIGLISVAIHRIMLIYFIIKLNKIKDFIPILIALVPFISIFSYLLYLADEIPARSFYPLVIQNVLVSVFAAVVLSNYFMNKNSNTAWLSIFGLLSTSLYFIVFIEKCFLSSLPPTYFTPVGMILFASSYYAFYKLVRESERTNTYQTS